jgi:FkbM family methyltransferase
VWALASSGAGRYLSLKRLDYSIRLHKRALSMAIWMDPLARVPEEVRLRSFLKPGDFVIDVGANIGTLSVTAARAVGPSGRVIAVEPHPASYRALCDNIRLNRVGYVTALNCALGAASAVGSLSNSRADDQNRISLDGTVRIRIDTLADLIGPEGEVALLKVDVEGYELEVLRGAGNRLSRVRVIQFEYDEAHLSTFGSSGGELLDYLTSRDFRVLMVVGADLVPIPEGFSSPRRLNLFAVNRALDER